MQKPSELELFLRSQSSLGVVESEGHFTLAKEEALKKLATYRLPFDEAWAVKIIQSVVAAKSSSPIHVELLARGIHFFFQQEDYSLAEFEQQFFALNPAKKPV